MGRTVVQWASKLANVRDNLAEAFEEVKKIELLEDRMKLEQIRAAQAERDQVAGNIHHRAASS